MVGYMEKMWLAMYVYVVDVKTFNTLHLHYSYTPHTISTFVTT